MLITLSCREVFNLSAYVRQMVVHLRAVIDQCGLKSLVVTHPKNCSCQVLLCTQNEIGVLFSQQVSFCYMEGTIHYFVVIQILTLHQETGSMMVHHLVCLTGVIL